jgi:transcriptional regulator with XRE-family HTH domain
MVHPAGKAEKVGEILRRARESRQLGLDEIAKRTKISQRFLGAIEGGNYGILPSDVFVRGFLRSYAKILGLDPEEMVELYKQERGIATLLQEEEPGKPLPLFVLWLAVAAGVLLVGAVLTFIFWPREAPAPIPAAPVLAAPVERSPEPARPALPPAAGALDSIELLFSRHCWALVKADGVKAFEGFKESGDQLKYEIRESFYLKVGDAGAVLVTHAGKPYPKLGDDGQPVELNIAAGTAVAP